MAWCTLTPTDTGSINVATVGRTARPSASNIYGTAEPKQVLIAVGFYAHTGA
jgi:hypothetical protein